jgi:predicted Fe-S protein YdhL (DUF1289 family)
MSDPLTPCRKICVLDEPSGLCRGCGRNRTEIAAWLGMSNSERARIMAMLPERLAALGVAASAGQ